MHAHHDMTPEEDYHPVVGRDPQLLEIEAGHERADHALELVRAHALAVAADAVRGHQDAVHEAPAQERVQAALFGDEGPAVVQEDEVERIAHVLEIVTQLGAHDAHVSACPRVVGVAVDHRDASRLLQFFKVRLQRPRRVERPAIQHERPRHVGYKVARVSHHVGVHADLVWVEGPEVGIVLRAGHVAAPGHCSALVAVLVDVSVLELGAQVLGVELGIAMARDVEHQDVGGLTHDVQGLQEVAGDAHDLVHEHRPASMLLYPGIPV